MVNFVLGMHWMCGETPFQEFCWLKRTFWIIVLLLDFFSWLLMLGLDDRPSSTYIIICLFAMTLSCIIFGVTLRDALLLLANQ